MDASIQVVASGSAIGADILGADLSRGLDARTFQAIETAFNEHSVVCIRDQHLTEEQYIAFARRFGEVEIIPLEQEVIARRVQQER